MGQCAYCANHVPHNQQQCPMCGAPYRHTANRARWVQPHIPRSKRILPITQPAVSSSRKQKLLSLLSVICSIGLLLFYAWALVFREMGQPTKEGVGAGQMVLAQESAAPITAVESDLATGDIGAAVAKSRYLLAEQQGDPTLRKQLVELFARYGFEHEAHGLG